MFPSDNDQNSSIDNGNFGDQDGPSQAQGGINPAFNPLLQELPQDLHEKILPHLKSWDEGVNNKLRSVQQQYEPWKNIIGAGVDPDTAQAGINMINMLEQNPKLLYDALRDYYK